MAGKCRASDITQITPLEFTIIKSRVMNLSKPPQCMIFSRTVMDEKSLSPLFFVVRARGGGGARLQMTCA